MAINTTNSANLGEVIVPAEFWDDYIIELASPRLVHNQFGQRKPIPPNNGKTIVFRKYDALPPATTALTEGVTPDGQDMTATDISSMVSQYGGYVAYSDVLDLTAKDGIVRQAVKLISAQAGETLDTVTREVLASGTNVQFGDGTVEARDELTAGDILTVNAVRKAVRTLRAQDAKEFGDGYYVGIIHPDAAYDLMSDPDWKAPHEYVDTENIYKGEIGRIAGVRFVETTRAKVFAAAGAAPEEGDAPDVYATLIVAENAYGITDVTGGGLHVIIKQMGSAGSGDPLEQRATVGWKALTTAEILVEQYMVRIETCVSE
ncbi:hypothetical protein FACS18949_14300 [Clostridia bacterium]|nr:hypothetical protein FACS189425_07110 [Clostridia bacterium]GHV35747.1 hypothetical protein FACS18949_14300 [Clostridia bacterium]